MTRDLTWVLKVLRAVNLKGPKWLEASVRLIEKFPLFPVFFRLASGPRGFDGTSPLASLISGST